MKTVYFSKPYTISEEEANAVECNLIQYRVNVISYKRGEEYDDSLIKNADLVIITLPDEEVNVADLSPGIQKELILCTRMKKKTISYFYDNEKNKVKLATICSNKTKISKNKNSEAEAEEILMEFPKEFIEADLTWLNGDYDFIDDNPL